MLVFVLSSVRPVHCAAPYSQLFTYQLEFQLFHAKEASIYMLPLVLATAEDLGYDFNFCFIQADPFIFLPSIFIQRRITSNMHLQLLI